MPLKSRDVPVCTGAGTLRSREIAANFTTLKIARTSVVLSAAVICMDIDVGVARINLSYECAERLTAQSADQIGRRNRPFSQYAIDAATAWWDRPVEKSHNWTIFATMSL